MEKIVLHVGCGPKHVLDTFGFAAADGWSEVRLDIDPEVKPDITGSITDMSAVKDAGYDAVYSSHNLEHLEPHQVPLAIAEFRRVLKPEGFAVCACPDIQSVAALVAEGKLLEPAYHTEAGIPIAPLDIMFGWRPALAAGNEFMAHRCAFTLPVLMRCFTQGGFACASGKRQEAAFALAVVASVEKRSEEEMRALLARHIRP